MINLYCFQHLSVWQFVIAVEANHSRTVKITLALTKLSATPATVPSEGKWAAEIASLASVPSFYTRIWHVWIYRISAVFSKFICILFSCAEPFTCINCSFFPNRSLHTLQMQLGADLICTIYTNPIKHLLHFILLVYYLLILET